jgi:hypothetical protein
MLEVAIAALQRLLVEEHLVAADETGAEPVAIIGTSTATVDG